MTVRRDPRSLEGAIFRAAQAVGGCEEASLLLGRTASTCSQASNPNHAAMIRLDDAITLDRMAKESTGATPILDHFAETLGRALPASGLTLGAHQVQLTRGHAALSVAVTEALADGTLSAAERAEIGVWAREQRAAIERLIADLSTGGELT